MSGYDQRKARSTRRNFGQSWWGEAWVEAIEKRAHLDANRLPRGRTYARWGYVGDLTVSPGVVSALVEGSGPRPYRTFVRVREFSDTQWSALFDVIASKVAHSAVLADGELSPQLVDDAAVVGIELLPTEGEINTGCSCADGANPCKHGAAVCYLIADLLDEDPFSLLHLRGRTQDEISKALHTRRKSVDAPPQTNVASENGVDARQAFADYTPGPQTWPKVPKPQPRPATPIALTPDMPKDTDVSREDLVALATDASLRAWELCNGIGNGGLDLHWYSDIVRRSVPLLETVELARLARTARVPLAQLEEDAKVWRAGKQEAFDEVGSKWNPDRRALQPGVRTLQAGGETSIRENRVTCEVTGEQLRLGESGRWYRFEKSGNAWRFVAIEPALGLR